MLPFIRPGDRVTVDIWKKNIKIYDIVLYKSGEKTILHRVIGKRDESYIVCGDNESICETVLPKQIIGVATKCKYKTITVDMTSKLMHFLAFCKYRLKMTFVPKIFFKTLKKLKLI